MEELVLRKGVASIQGKNNNIFDLIDNPKSSESNIN